MQNINFFSYKKNRLQQIRGFCYAARLHSISEAARMMNLTQSTVTLQIQSLERDLGLKLLNRDSKPVYLTEAGEDFYKMACRLMHEFESVVEKFLDKRQQKEQQIIDIAMHHIAISRLMPQVISFFKKSYPESKITIRNIAPGEALKRLKEGKIDLAFYPNSSRLPEIEYREVASYDPILIMNKNHALAKRELKSLKDLARFDLIRIDRSLITLPMFEEAAKSYGFKGSIEFENGSWEMLKFFVKKNDFVAVVSAICLDSNDSDLVTKNLARFFPKMSYFLMRKAGILQKAIVQDFVKAIDEVAKEFEFSVEED